MKYFSILVLSSLLFFSNSLVVQAGILDQPIGARSAGLGLTGIALTDFWSALNNQAGLASIKKLSVGIYAENKFLIKSLNTQAFAVVQPVNNGSFGVSIIRFGEVAYNETLIGIAYGLRLSTHFSAGIQLFHYAVNQSNHLGTTKVFSFQGGFMYIPDERIRIAFHVLSPEIISRADAEIKLPEIVRFGLGYELSKSLLGFIEFQSHAKLGQGINSGVEFQNPKNLAFRIGYSSLSKKITFGIGLKIQNLGIDFASSMHNQLGYSPQLSISYSFEK